MLNRRVFFLVFFYSVILTSVCASVNKDKYKFNRVDVEKSLSNNEVRCIFKDRAGFLWFGTPSGLNRYDGYEIKSIKLDLNTVQETTSNNDIWKIQEDADGLLWLKTRVGDMIYDPEHECFLKSQTALFNKYAGTDNFWSVYIDEGKSFWFVTWEDIRLYDIKQQKRKIFEQGLVDGLSRGLVADIKQGKNRYWFLFDNGLLECMDAQTHKIISRDSTLHKLSKIKNERDMRLFVDSAGDVWVYGIGSRFGVAYYNTSHRDWNVYSSYSLPPYQISNNVITAIEEGEDGSIWIGTDHGGVNVVDKKNRTVTTIQHEETDPLSLSQNTIKSLYKDDTGIMWLGTYKKGVCYYHESIYKFKSIESSSQLPYRDVNCFHEASNGNLWIGTNGGGLIYFDRKRREYTQYKHDPSNPNTPAGDVIVSIEEDGQGRIWIGYYLEGLDCFDGKKFTNYMPDPLKDNGLTDNNVWVLHSDRSGHLWIGTLRGGVVVFDETTGERIKHFETNGSVYALVESRTGDIFIGAQSGLYIYNVATEKMELYEPDIFQKIHLNRNDINNLCEDSRGLLWIGTRNGLFVFNPYTKDMTIYTQKNGLSADIIQSIIEDSDDNIWIATNGGLTCVKVSTKVETPGYFFQLINYDSSEGLQSEQFNYNAAYMTSKSELIFGGSSGFNLFTPSQIYYNTNSPKAVITDFQIYNKSIIPLEKYDGRVLLEKSIGQTEQIKLKYSDNYFSLTFAALDYCMPSKSRYYYKLEGFNDQWLETDRTGRRATYTNLNPGTYLFKLMAVNNDGVESEEPVKLRIVISPPIWNTIGAWIVYILIALAAIIWYRRRTVLEAEKKIAYAQDRLKMNQQLQIEEMKLRFFTNISHEFKTPLTLILTPLEELRKQEEEEERQNLLGVIERNARKLLILVTQLLDFRKLDAKAHKILKSHGDVIQFLREQAQLFNEAMYKKQINFTFDSEPSSLFMWFDADKLSKVLVNILSNAYKFTSEGGNVAVSLELLGEDRLSVTITDDGIGIPEAELEKVFDRFYQVESSEEKNYQGSGLGLHIAKEFIELHGGEIKAKFLSEGGTCFVFTLPITREGEEEMEAAVEGLENDKLDVSVAESSQEGKLPKLLIVEDNTELRLFLTDRLKNDYILFQAADGVEGQEIAFEEIPDLILSDVMMSGKNGIELCQTLKADIRTSHIPFILLTAKSGEESKLEGLNAGADDYITKPFNLNILKAKIRNIVEARKRVQDEFQQQIKIEPSKIAISSLDEKLISKALEYTEQNMSNPEYSVEELSRELGMSRVHLYKKLSSLTGKTPIEFIRIIRLKRAAQLLMESQLTVSEIAYEVGFNNPKYFRKYFKDEFGILPSQYGTRSE